MYWLVFLLYCASAASVSRKQQPQSEFSKYTIQMIGYSPMQNDDYVAVAREAPEGYIVGFEPLAHADRIHHILLYGCGEPAHSQTFWRGGETCGMGVTHILYAWARNAPTLLLPRNVAFSVGHEDDGIKYFVLQVHYAQPFAGDVKDFSGVTLHMTHQKPPNLAAVLLFVSSETIPPGRNQVQINVSCEYDGAIDLHPFAFRTHTHAMGRVVSAYYKHDGQWTKIGARNPQWPQLFESISTNPVIKKGDLMAATCRFDSHDKKTPTPMGSMGVNEMCNFYMMFYYDSTKENPFPWSAVCGGRDRAKEMVREYPVEGTQLLPSRPDLEHHAHQSKIPFGIVEEGSFTSIGDIRLGQVAGISFQGDNVIIFHRAGRVWDQSTFDQYHVLMNKEPINEDVILIVSITGNETRIVKKLGKNKFYLPHGIYMDNEGYLYTTDVGSHTVAKWKLSGNDLVQIWESGVKLIPDSERTHFCKPAGVVKTDEGVFVADGYCNSRIVQLDSTTGNRMHEFGLPGNGPGQFNLPHDVVMTSTGGHLLVADRENGRVQELSTRGDYIMEWTSSLFTNIYSADAHNDHIYMIPGRPDRESGPIRVYVGRAGTELIEFAFGPTSRSFGQPHVLRVSPDGERIFVGDIAAGRSTLWMFRIQHEGGSSSLHSSYAFTGAFRSASTAATGTTGILISLAFAVLVVGFVVIRRRRAVSIRGHANFDKKAAMEEVNKKVAGRLQCGPFDHRLSSKEAHERT
ncbi:hypothetical protein RB195_005396 [Necator americanus]|uniref:Peptidylglycine monooxygenase n=1 Tax=Necator americanus TaxID=51031 RepID=A0ABR1BRG7_NECAM